MTEIHNRYGNINRENLVTLHSILIYGSCDSSAYSSFIEPYFDLIQSELSNTSLDVLDTFLKQLESEPSAGRIALIEDFEARETALFKRLYADLLTAFYSAPETAERVRRLADAGPREASPHFEPSLLDGVIARQSGRRRL